MSTDMFPQGFIDYMTERAKPRRERLHRWFERKTGIIFGTFRASGHTSSGYPMADFWITVGPRKNGYAFCVTSKSRGLYVDYVREARR